MLQWNLICGTTLIHQFLKPMSLRGRANVGDERNCGNLLGGMDGVKLVGVIQYQIQFECIECIVACANPSLM